MLVSKMLLVNAFFVCLAIGLGAANELKVTQDNWLLDKTNDSSVQISGSRLTANFTPIDTDPRPYFNALYLGIVANETNKRYYWEFTCVKNCYSVGVAKKDHYLDGRSIKGAFLHHNLHDNEQLLVSDFADGIQDGDRIEFILDAGEQELKIYVLQNDRPLGLAYVQKAPYASELYPAVIFSDTGTVEINEKKNFNTDHLLVRGDRLVKGVQGDYLLVKMTVNGTTQNVRSYRLELGKPEGEEGKIRFNFQVGNDLDGLIVKQGKDAEGDLYTLEEADWTKMGIFGKTQEDEELIFPAMQNLKRVKFSNNFGKLTILCEPDTTLLFERFVAEKKPHETSDLLG